ncbi:MAG: YggS family pyridoxal phosphate-dependent enzyme [Paludibacter sp.]|nr:YggS family pyridoxal phosphate-dependent enzyme [Paludibacter sp.]
MSVVQNLEILRKAIPENVTLVCVSKFHPESSILEAYRYGERVFGESKVQELTEKYLHLPKDIQWHFIGHLQTNKVKYLVPFVKLIHGVDSLKLLAEIDKQATKIDKVVDCLLQVHIATEETKFGFSAEEIIELFESGEIKKNKHVKLRGLMGMATFTQNELQVKNEFQTLKKLFDLIKSKYETNNANFSEISMGMSDDYPIAIKEGSTMVRIGSFIFGNRIY